MKNKHIKNWLYFYIHFLLLTTICFSGPVEITGKIIDSETREPLAGVNVLVQGTMIGASSDLKGHFQIKYVSSDSATLIFSYIGYAKKSVYIQSQNKQMLLIALKKQPLPFKGYISIVASKSTLNNFRQTVPATVIQQVEIERASAITISELLKKKPAVSMVGGAYYAAPSIRGLARHRIITMVDQEKVTSERNVGAPGSFINPTDVKRIEIIRGPYSTLYGSEAIGGVINIVTRDWRPPLYWKHLGGSLNVSYNSVNNAWNGDFAFNSRIAHFYLQAKVGKRKGQSYKDGAGAKVVNTFFDEQYAKLKLSFIPNEKHRLNLYWRYSAGNNIGKPAYDINTNARHNPDDHRMYGFKYVWKNINGFIPQLTFQLSRHDHILGAIIDKHKVESDPSDDKIINNWKNIINNDYTARLETRFVIGQKATMLTGFHGFFRENIHLDEHKIVHLYQTGAFVKEEKMDLLYNGSQRSYGIFLQSDYMLAENIDLSGGLRFDLIKTKKENRDHSTDNKINPACSGNIGISYRPKHWLNFTFNMGKAFRAPQIKELYITTITPGGMNIANPYLAPERSLNMDWGLKMRNDNGSLGFALFRNQINDMITLDWNNKTANRVGTFKNIGKALLYGGEFNFQYIIDKNWLFDGNLSHTIGRDMITHDELMDVPPLQINAELTHTLWNNRIQLSLAGRYSAKQTEVAEDDFPTAAFTLIDFYVRWEFQKSLRLNLALTNLLNEKYREHYQFNWMRGPGRSINIGLNIIF